MRRHNIADSRQPEYEYATMRHQPRQPRHTRTPHYDIYAFVRSHRAAIDILFQLSAGIAMISEGINASFADICSCQPFIFQMPRSFFTRFAIILLIADVTLHEEVFAAEISPSASSFLCFLLFHAGIFFSDISIGMSF